MTLSHYIFDALKNNIHGNLNSIGVSDNEWPYVWTRSYFGVNGKNKICELDLVNGNIFPVDPITTETAECCFVIANCRI